MELDNGVDISWHYKFTPMELSGVDISWHCILIPIQLGSVLGCVCVYIIASYIYSHITRQCGIYILWHYIHYHIVLDSRDCYNETYFITPKYITALHQPTFIFHGIMILWLIHCQKSEVEKQRNSTPAIISDIHIVYCCDWELWMKMS